MITQKPEEQQAFSLCRPRRSQTRLLMLEELQADLGDDAVYLSTSARSGTREAYIEMMRDAFQEGESDSLVDALESSGILKSHQTNGHRINIRASAEALGDGQFVAYYTRAVARRADEEGREIEIYRGQETKRHRPESDQLIDTRPSPSELLSELRQNSGEPGRFSEVGKANSGLTVQLI